MRSSYQSDLIRVRPHHFSLKNIRKVNEAGERRLPKISQSSQVNSSAVKGAHSELSTGFTDTLRRLNSHSFPDRNYLLICTNDSVTGLTRPRSVLVSEADLLCSIFSQSRQKKGVTGDDGSEDFPPDFCSKPRNLLHLIKSALSPLSAINVTGALISQWKDSKSFSPTTVS